GGDGFRFHRHRRPTLRAIPEWALPRRVSPPTRSQSQPRLPRPTRNSTPSPVRRRAQHPLMPHPTHYSGFHPVGPGRTRGRAHEQVVAVVPRLAPVRDVAVATGLRTIRRVERRSPRETPEAAPTQ